MPGQVSAGSTQRSTHATPVDVAGSQPYIKDEDDVIGNNEDDDGAYRPKPQLPKPFVFMRTLADLIKDLDNDLIDVDPEYQREVVWTADRMTGLINSLMENFYIPPIILNKKTPTDESKPAVHVCVDGKQRLSSVRAFVKGMIPCHDHRNEKWWFCDTPTSRRKKVLPEDTQRMFLAKEFVSFEFKDLQPDQEEDLFARVQMGVQLSLAEKMRASTGPWQELARLFVDDFPIIYTLMKDRARAKDFQLTLSCFSQIVEVMHPSASDGIPILKTNYNALPKLLSNKGAVDDGLKSHLASVWNTFKDLIAEDPDTFTNANKYLRGVQTFAPVEMVAVTVLISMYSDTRNKRLLLGDIQALREAIREEFGDIRTNSTVWKFIWKWLEGLEAIRGAVDGSTVYRRPLPPANAMSPASRTKGSSNPTTVAKRAGTVRTKAPANLPPPQGPVVKKESSQATSMTPPQPKRRRTDDSPVSPPTSALERSPVSSAINDTPGPQLGPLDAQLAWYACNNSQAPPISTQTSAPPLAQVHARAPRSKTISPHEEAGLRTSAREPMKSWPKQASSAFDIAQFPSSSSTAQPPLSSFHTSQFPSGSSTAQPPMMFTDASPYASPIELAQDVYRAPTAPMTSTASHELPSVSLQEALSYSQAAWKPSTTFSNVQSYDKHRSYTPNNNNGSTLKTGLGAYSPSHTEQQWAGEVRWATPPRETASSASTARRTGSKPRKAAPRPTVTQYDGAIDLTSDTEQERQDLLLSFKAKALAGKSQKNASLPTPSADASRKFMYHHAKEI